LNDAAALTCACSWRAPPFKWRLLRRALAGTGLRLPSAAPARQSPAAEARSVTQRADWSRSSVRVLLFVACASSALCADRVAQTTLPDDSIIELRVARTSPAPGYAQRGSVGDTSFFLSDAVLLSDSDIEDARAEPTEDAAKQTFLVIKLHLKAQAARRVAESTRAHVGDRVALLLNQHLVAAPPIVGEVGGGAHLDIFVGPPAPLDQIAAAVAARWHAHH
jgi:hypothetical protein